MKQQFLDLKGLTELVGYLKDSIANKKVILPYASSTLFPSVGDINTVYIDTATNSIYRWDSTNKKYEMLAKAVKSVSISESTENGKITLTVDGTKTTVPIHGLKSAAYTESSAYATAGHTHTKAQVGLGNVDNTADKDKSVKHATTADSATSAGTATTATNVSGQNAYTDDARHVWFSVKGTETQRAYNDNFTYNPVKNLLTTNITGSAASASSVPWTGVTGKPSTFTASAHNHDDSTITSLNASKLFGTIDIARLPQGALERCVIVEDDTARFKLTTANIQLGDTVKVNKTQKMYFVINESKLNSEEGYTVYTAGTATSVPWSGVTGKPSTFTPSSHTHPYLSALSVSGRTITYTKGDGTTGTITTQDTWRGIQNNLTSDSTTDSLAAAQGKVLKGLVDGKLPLSGGTLTGRLTIKGDAATSPLVVRGIAGSDGQGNIADLYLQYQTNSPIHLGNDGTYTISADGSLYSGTAANAKAVPWTGVTGRPSSMPASDVYAWAKASTKPSYSWGEITGKPGTFTPTSHSHSYITASASSSAVPTKAADGRVEFYYNVNNGLANNMPSTNNANAIISLSRHAGDYPSQLGFSSDGNIYYREGVGTTAWKTIITSSNYTSYTTTKTGGGASGTWGINVSGGAAYPTGFNSRATSATWGNQTGTLITDWHTSNGGDIQFRDNSGQLNVITDGFFYQNEGRNLVLDSVNYSNYAATKSHTHSNYMGAVSANGYYGMAKPDGSASDWIRTTSSGIIPYQNGGRGSGHGGIGTSSWYFSSSYVDNTYCNKSTIADKVRMEFDTTNNCLNFVFL